MAYNLCGTFRMRSYHRLLTLTFITFISCCADVRNAAAQSEYTITDLGTLGGPSSFAYGINNSGHITGNSPPKAASNTHAFYFDDEMHDLGTLGSSGNVDLGSFSAGNKINDSNQIVGTTLDDTGHPQAFSWDAQHGMQSLGLFNTNGAAINSLGQIVGETASITVGQIGQAFMWDPRTGAQWLPPLPGCSLTNATGVNNSSTVVGFCSSSTNSIRAFVWDNIHGIQALAPGALESIAWSINNERQIAGSITVNLGVGRAVTWASPSSTQQLLPLIADPQGNVLNTDAYSINDRGEVVGIAGQNAAIWIGSAGYLLDNLILASSGWHLIQANAINNNGQIAGYGVINGQTHAFRLDPVKENRR